MSESNEFYKAEVKKRMGKEAIKKVSRVIPGWEEGLYGVGCDSPDGKIKGHFHTKLDDGSQWAISCEGEVFKED